MRFYLNFQQALIEKRVLAAEPVQWLLLAGVCVVVC
jgi:hypothetical protein